MRTWKRWLMARVDKERVLVKIDQLGNYLNELREVAPQTFDEYLQREKKRSCERLLQVAIECVIDICNLLVSGLRLGVPAEEEDLFEKLLQAKVVSKQLESKLRDMKGFGNVLVHEYTHVDDRIVFDAAKSRVHVFEVFNKEILRFLNNQPE
jgi:uncharacterized protein YutE (UPF0331/DUF86 family)